MAKILVVEDDPLWRQLIALHLESASYHVVTADDGMQGLHKATEHMPDLIVTDHWMPNIDGISMLAALRANYATSSIPVIMLTGDNAAVLAERARAFDVSGYLIKPFEREALLRVVARHAPRLQDEWANSTAPAATQAQTALAAAQTGDMASGSDAGRTVDGTVLVYGIQDFALATDEIDEDQHIALVRAFYDSAHATVEQHGGWVAKCTDSSVIALFEGVGHAARALSAAAMGVLGIHRLVVALAPSAPLPAPPVLVAGAGVHTGPVSICHLTGGQRGEHTIIGDTVNVAARLQHRSWALGWSIVCGGATSAAAGAGFAINRRGQIGVKGRDAPLDIVEIASVPVQAGQPLADEAVCAAVNSALYANTVRQSSGEPSAGAAGSGEWLGFSASAAVDAPILVEGYRLVRKIGEGGVAQVFLADHAASAGRRVLKMVRVTDEEEGDVIQRFIHEFALLSQIDHPNVARIHEQGFEGAHAFIAMEYFPGGDLRGLMKRGISHELAVAILIQVAGGLGAVHDAGVVHRDLKPDNIMIRADGSLAIADFGIAKSLSQSFGTTQHGDVVGTPYYLAPEQALGASVDGRADIYSLGVMFYELLSGQRAYEGVTALGLLSQHVHGAIPQLPGALKHYQPLVDGMMCKRPEDRIGSASAIIDNILALQLA